MCLVFALLVPVLFGPAIATKYNREALVAVAFAMNWDRALALGPSYFLGHAWSLSIEAQFYLIWPLVLFFLQRGTKSLRPVLLAAAVLAFASGAWRVFLQDGGATPMRLFNGLDTRADSLMTGCLLAVVVVFCEHSRAQLVRLRWCLKLMAPVALITLIGLANLGRWPQAWVYLYGFVLAQVATAILILHVQLDHDGRIGRLLRTSWLVWLGTVSYGLYLWHFPIYMTLFALRMDPTLVILLGSALSLLVATISYYGMERPILAYKTRWGLTTPVTP
jgi:peptidoglycan/LPS O-acetylase OafA/YrhL